MKKVLSVLLICLLTLNNFVTISSAKSNENIKIIEDSIIVSLDGVKPGDSITVFEDHENNYKVVIDVLAMDSGVTPYDTGDSGWSSGTIPSGGVLKLYPHIEGVSGGHKEMGFFEYVEYKNGTSHIIDADHPVVETGFAINIIEDPIVRVKNHTATTITAKASMSWVSSSIALGITCNNYLTHELNKIGQSKLSWKFQS